MKNPLFENDFFQRWKNNFSKNEKMASGIYPNAIFTTRYKWIQSYL